MTTNTTYVTNIQVTKFLSNLSALCLEILFMIMSPILHMLCISYLYLAYIYIVYHFYDM